MCAVVPFQFPYPMLCPLYGKTLVKKPVTGPVETVYSGAQQTLSPKCLETKNPTNVGLDGFTK